MLEKKNEGVKISNAMIHRFVIFASNDFLCVKAQQPESLFFRKAFIEKEADYEIETLAVSDIWISSRKGAEDPFEFVDLFGGIEGCSSDVEFDLLNG